MQVHGERRAGHRLKAGLGAAAAFGVNRVASVEPRGEANGVWIGEQDLPRRIDRDTAPVEHAIVTRIDKGTLLGGWGEYAFVAQPLEDDSASKLIERRAAPHVLFENDALRLVRELGEWLRR